MASGVVVLYRLCGFENSEDRCRIAEVTQSPSIGRDMLVRQGSNAEEISDLVKRTAKSLRRRHALEATHRSVSIFDPTVILFEPVIQVHAGAMQNIFAKFTLDGPWVAIMTIGGDAIRDDTSHRSRRTKEGFGGRKVPMLAQITSTSAPSRSIARYR